MLHLLYKTTNLLNGHIYIGVHSTLDENDGYIGSGREFLCAVRKFGRENFSREIIGRYETREELMEAERAIVNHDFLARNDVYNRALGGGSGVPAEYSSLEFRDDYYSEEAKEIAKHYATIKIEYEPLTMQWVLKEISKIYFEAIQLDKLNVSRNALGLISRHLCTSDVFFTRRIDA